MEGRERVLCWFALSARSGGGCRGAVLWCLLCCTWYWCLLCYMWSSQRMPFVFACACEYAAGRVYGYSPCQHGPLWLYIAAVDRLFYLANLSPHLADGDVLGAPPASAASATAKHSRVAHPTQGQSTNSSNEVTSHAGYYGEYYGELVGGEPFGGEPFGEYKVLLYVPRGGLGPSSDDAALYLFMPVRSLALRIVVHHSRYRRFPGRRASPPHPPGQRSTAPSK